jgi:hypothetical protein
MDDIGDKLQELNKNTEKLPPQISGGVLKASGGTLMGGKITTDAINSFRTLTNLGITGETMEALQGTEPELYNEMLEQVDNNEANEIRVYEELNRIQQQNTILEAQIRSNRQTLRDYELEIQRDTEERQMIPRLREQLDYDRNVERLNRIYEEIPNRPAERVVGYNYNYPSAPILRTQIDYSNLNRILLERQQVERLREEQDEDFDITLEPTQSDPVVEMTPRTRQQEQTNLADEELEVIQEEVKEAKEERQKKEQEEKKKELERFKPTTIQPTTSRSTKISSEVFTTPSALDEQRRREETQKKETEDTERRQEP